MSKIKIIADSACDITREAAKKWDIEVLPLTILHGDAQYRDWYDFTPDEFYVKLYEWDPLPTTCQVSPTMFVEAFEQAIKEGYDSMIVVCLNGNASGTYQSACIAKDMFYEKKEHEQYKIEVIDSTSYAYLIGLYLEKAAEKIRDGVCFDEVTAYLKERYERVQAFAIVYTLDFLKRTGRINGATNFVANLLDIKPILLIGNGEIRPKDKVRGKKKSVMKLIELVKAEIDPNEKEISIVYGDMNEEFEELKEAIQVEFPNFKVNLSKMGSVIALNAGPKLLGIAYMKKK